MKILFNGDSNVAGEELKNRSKSMAGVIADHYCAKSINLAVSGGSNERIYNSTLDYLSKNTSPDLVIIGWTEHSREQWYLNGQFYEVNNLNVGVPLPDNFKKRYQFWKDRVQYDPLWQRIIGFYWHNKIYNLHTMLLEKNIKHIFFNAFEEFQHPESEQLDWVGNFFNPYNRNKCYVRWCEEAGFKQITPGWYHFDESAHLAWGNLLISEIEKINS